MVVGSSNDPAEHEADRVARDVVALLQRSSDHDSALGHVATDDAGALRRATRIQRRSDGAAEVGAEGGELAPGTESRINAARGGGKPLPPELGGRLQRAFGADFGSVRLHDDAGSRKLNRSMQARAFTTQNDIFLGEGAPSLDSPAGTTLLAHELTHVVQQSEGPRRSIIRRVTAPADLQVAAEQKAEALKAHRKDRAALMQIVKDGKKSSDRRTANACEWILDGRTKLYALNATGDSTERIAHLGEARATTEVWFPKGDGGAGHLNDGIAEYNENDLDDDTNIVVDTDDGPSTNGWNGDGFIAVMMGGGKMAKADVLETLRHEVQHDSDKNREKQTNAVAIADDQEADSGEMAKKFERYKTEYRAYNYEGSKKYNKLSPTKVVEKYGFKWSQRQLAIFQGIYAGYDHTVEYWDDSHLSNGSKAGAPTDKGSYHNPNIADRWKKSIEARRRALVDYVNPDDEGFNKWDSIRVDDFYQALDAVPMGTAEDSGKPMSNLSWKAAGLGKKDALYVLEESPDMRKKMREHLIGSAYVKIMNLLSAIAGVKQATAIQDLGKNDVKHIQAVSEALDKVPVGTSNTKDPAVRTLRFATAKLTKSEAKTVLGHESKLLNKIDLKLTGQAHTDYLQLLQECVG